MDLLSKLYLPGVRVDILENTIQGNNLQIRINDIIATTNDLIAILPDDVLRVEHITMPGAEYGAEVGEVINIITKKRISGITGGVNLTNWINGIYGNDNVNFKANHKDSEFALNYTFGYSRYGKVYQNSSEIFLLKDGSEFTRKRDGLPGTQKLFTHSPSVNYNLRKDNITLNMLLRGDIYDLPVNKASTLISDETDAISSQSHISNKYYRPSADIYLKTNFKNNQYLIVDVLGTYTNTDYSRTYTEIYRDQSSETFDYKTDGDKYSLIAEARYGMTFKNNDNFSAGLKYDQSYMNNLYKNFNGDVLSDDKLNNYDMYMFTQYQGAVKEFRYGVGAGYSRQYYSMNGKKHSFNAFRPNLNLMYPFGKFIARYNFAINTMNPQLSQLSEFEQWQNAYEVTVGNPLLKPSRSIVNALNLQFSTEKIELSINTYHQLSLKAFAASSIQRIDEADDTFYFLYRYDNQRNFAHLQFILNVRATLIEQHLYFTAFGGINRYFNRGNDFYNNYTGYIGNFQLNGSYNNWSAQITYSLPMTIKFVETKIKNSSRNSALISYQYKSASLGVGFSNILTKGKVSESDLRSRVVRKRVDTYNKSTNNIVSLRIGWNFNRGRKYNSESKSIDNRDTDTGIVM
ncbi:MAG: outer membrane beta-barrel family protein [Rikenellaceae bacterium]|nr:outer membrane beta-barrel family protein [Rikenellaceae bacterium]